MSPIEQIIDELTDMSKSLMGPILKTKVFASRIGNQEIADWADKEATGYRDQSDCVPGYRATRPVFKSTYSQATVMKTDVPLPMTIFDDEIGKLLFKPREEPSVSALELIMDRKSEEGQVRKVFGADFCQMLTSRIINNASHNITIYALAIITDISEIAYVLASIRSKLLDFMLKLEMDLPQLETSAGKAQPLRREDQERVTNIFNQTIFVTGDGNTVAIGAGNSIK